ncbi:MAG: hypothetical protein QNJ16_21600, partial [Rhodobacter sp.]|nr:hypothetical protein [Rhodobacter sp.]
MPSTQQSVLSSIAPVFSLPGTTYYSGGPNAFYDAGHSAALSVASGTVSVGFRMDGTQGSYALISKDSRGKN